MFLTVHAAAGAAIGMAIPNVPAAFTLGIVSHFLLDRVPHYDPPLPPGTAKDGILHNPVFQRFVAISLVDLVVAGLLTLALTRLLPSISAPGLIAGAFGSIVPDLMFGLYRLTNNRWLGKYNRWHEANHFDPKKFPVTFLSGMIPQLVTLGVCLLIVR